MVRASRVPDGDEAYAVHTSIGGEDDAKRLREQEREEEHRREKKREALKQAEKTSKQVILLVVLVLIAGAYLAGAYFGAPGISNRGGAAAVDEGNNHKPADDTMSDSPSSDPTMAATNPPSLSPLYPRNSPDDCERITRGVDVSLQSELIPKFFDIRMDVSMTLQLEDLSEVVEEVESRIQRILGPRLADCPNARRLRQPDWTRRLQIETNVIGNARFNAEYQPDQSCDASAPTPCIRVVTRLNLFFKGEEDTFPLIDRIFLLFGEQELTETLGLSAPFNQIKVVDVTTARSPTLVPTQLPSSNPTASPLYPASESPSSDPTMAATNPPSLSPLYPRNSPDDCEGITRGVDVSLQSELIPKFVIFRMDVSLTLQLSDLSEVAEAMRLRMQEIWGPRLADCPNARRLRQQDWTRRLQIEENLIGNARFNAEYQPDQSCDASAPTPCIRVVTRLNLFLKGEEAMVPLLTRISSLIGEQELTETLGLSAPFNQIKVVDVTTARPTTLVPTQLPSANP
ncbi:unnamed protein product [Cylindrotheca closterium]|uniref:Uncharacterized protein n=1 Tax=Cylindrotheca closterium TaxID=2856 RepID=A0AAD2CI24_9STRA|nr:unnamed protein product [Cylindrotheca closterium]